MNRFSALILIITTPLLLFTSCKKDIPGCMDPNSINYNAEATISNNSCEYEGEASFWMDESGDIDLWVNNVYKGKISSYFPTYSPACGQAGTLTVTMEPGTYPYKAESLLYEWSGTVTIGKNSCGLILLD